MLSRANFELKKHVLKPDKVLLKMSDLQPTRHFECGSVDEYSALEFFCFVKFSSRVGNITKRAKRYQAFRDFFGRCQMIVATLVRKNKRRRYVRF